MKLKLINNNQHIGVSERTGTSIVINEQKNERGQTRFSMPITDLQFIALKDAVNFLRMKGY